MDPSGIFFQCTKRILSKTFRNL